MSPFSTAQPGTYLVMANATLKAQDGSEMTVPCLSVSIEVKPIMCLIQHKDKTGTVVTASVGETLEFVIDTNADKSKIKTNITLNYEGKTTQITTASYMVVEKGMHWFNASIEVDGFSNPIPCAMVGAEVK